MIKIKSFSQEISIIKNEIKIENYRYKYIFFGKRIKTSEKIIPIKKIDTIDCYNTPNSNHYLYLWTTKNNYISIAYPYSQQKLVNKFIKKVKQRKNIQ